jgi:hypothetical protein
MRRASHRGKDDDDYRDDHDHVNRVRRLTTTVTDEPVVHPLAICERDAGWGKPLTHTPELSGNHTSRDIWGK